MAVSTPIEVCVLFFFYNTGAATQTSTFQNAIFRQVGSDGIPCISYFVIIDGSHRFYLKSKAYILHNVMCVGTTE